MLLKIESADEKVVQPDPDPAPTGSGSVTNDRDHSFPTGSVSSTDRETGSGSVTIIGILFPPG